MTVALQQRRNVRADSLTLILKRTVHSTEISRVCLSLDGEPKNQAERDFAQPLCQVSHPAVLSPAPLQ